MVYDYRHEVFSMIQAGRRRNNTHMSSDMDALVSSYLIQSMVQGRGDSADARLPAIAEDLVELTNLVDYGRYRTPDFKTFKESLVGIIGALRSVVAKNINYEFSEAVAAQKTSGGEPLFNEKGWRTTAGEEAYKAVCQKHDTILGRLTFKVLNIANVERLANSSMSLTECGSLILRKASPELRAVLEEGLEISRQQFENFEKEIVKGETIEINILTKEGFRRRILMTIISELDLPALSVINIGITLMPDRIFAGFAGPNRPSGDNYDLKVSTDVGEEVDLSEICIALNKAEAAARAKVLAKNRSLEEIQATPEDQRTLDEKKIIVWLTGNERFGQSGVSIPAEASVEEKRQLQIITRDPTVLVAGGSLIASSFTSVLSRQEFVDCLKSLK
jgi:dihydrofolate reductase